MKMLRSLLVLTLVLFGGPALAQVTPGTSPLSVAKGGTGATAITPYTVEALGFSNLNTAIAGIGSTQTTLVISKNYTLTASLTIPANVNLVITKGGGITKASTFTLTINGQLQATASQIFFGFSSGNVSIATFGNCYAEWWGAVVNDGLSDLTAINNALQACLHVQLLAGTYNTNGTILINRNFVTLHGDGLQTTTIQTNSATLDAIQVTGPSTASPLLDNEIGEFQSQRTVTPTTPGTAANAAAGIRVNKTLRTKVTNYFTIDDGIGIYMVNTINFFSEKTFGSRSLGISSDTYYFYYLDGVGTVGAGASANASSRITDALASAINVNSTGFAIFGQFSDTFLLRPEIGLMNFGFVVVGPTFFGLGDDRATVDLHIIQPIMDGVPSSGIGFYIHDIPKFGAVTIYGGYAAPASGATFAAAMQIASARNVTVGKGFQFIGWPSAASSTICLLVQNSTQLSIDGIWQDCLNPISTTGASASNFTGSIYNNSQTTGATAASLTTTSVRNNLSLSIDGNSAGQFSNGVLLDATSVNNTINAASITPTKITNIVNDNTVVPTTDGYIGATGNLVLGIGTRAPAVTSVATAGLASGGPITATGTVTVTAAAKSDQQAASSAILAVTPSQQQSHPSAAKSWVAFNGSAASCPATVCAFTGYNVTSVTRTSAGNYTVTWTTNFSSAIYPIFVQCNDNTSAAASFGLLETRSASAITYVCINPSTLLAGDATMTQAVSFGSQ